MNPKLIQHLYNLPSPPVLDVLGKWVHLRNARVGTTSMDEGPLKSRAVLHGRGEKLWKTVWEEIVLPKIDDAVIFTFVRNPWDRICSAFYQCRDRAETPANKIEHHWRFSDWVKEFLASAGPTFNMHFAEQYDTAYFQGEKIGFVGRFERMNQDWETLSKQISITAKLPHKNASGHGSYVDHYDEESQRIIAEMYQRDILAFGYEFGD